MSAAAETAPGSDGESLTIDGLHVETFGLADAPAVLFSAGLGGIGRYWTLQIEGLAHDHRVILYDHRGTGRSLRDPLPTPYAVTHLAQDMRAVLDGLGIARAHVVGHAAGAVAALDLARIAPDRVATIVSVNGWAVADPHFRRCFAIRRAIYAAGGVDAYLRAQPLFLFPADWISDHLGDLDAERAHQLAGFQDEATLLARMAALEAFDIRADLSAIACPVLVAVSEDDMLVPPHAAPLLAGGLPNGEIARFARGGHAVNITMAATFNHTLRAFLDAHRAAAIS